MKIFFQRPYGAGCYDTPYAEHVESYDICSIIDEMRRYDVAFSMPLENKNFGATDETSGICYVTKGGLDA